LLDVPLLLLDAVVPELGTAVAIEDDELPDVLVPLEYP
jgi:hypothetical protein